MALRLAALFEELNIIPWLVMLILFPRYYKLRTCHQLRILVNWWEFLSWYILKFTRKRRRNPLNLPLLNLWVIGKKMIDMQKLLLWFSLALLIICNKKKKLFHICYKIGSIEGIYIFSVLKEVLIETRLNDFEYIWWFIWSRDLWA